MCYFGFIVVVGILRWVDFWLCLEKKWIGICYGTKLMKDNPRLHHLKQPENLRLYHLTVLGIGTQQIRKFLTRRRLLFNNSMIKLPGIQKIYPTKSLTELSQNSTFKYPKFKMKKKSEICYNPWIGFKMKNENLK